MWCSMEWFTPGERKLIRYFLDPWLLSRSAEETELLMTVGSVFLQEFYIRHVDGLPIGSDAERDRIVQCLEAAIERRASEVHSESSTRTVRIDIRVLRSFWFLQGLELELCTEDRFGLLADITRIFRENSLCIRRAEISTKGGKAKDTFYVTDASGSPVDPRIVDSVRRQVGLTDLQVKHGQNLMPEPPETTVGYLFSYFFKPRSCQSKLIRSYS